MEIKKGEKVRVFHSRSGNWNGIATADFDTEKDEWYKINLLDKRVNGLSTYWEQGEPMPCRRGLCRIEKIGERK